MNLKRKVKYNVKKDKRLKKRKDNSHYLGRTYQDYLTFCETHRLKYVPQMDTVYNDISNGPFIQTFLFPQCDLLFAILHKRKDAESMVKGFLQLKGKLENHFSTLFLALLTDGGCEFSDAIGFETDKEFQETYLFYQEVLSAIRKKIYLLLEETLESDSPHLSSYMKTSLETIKKYKQYIKNTLSFDYSNGTIEDIDNLIKVIKRIAFGYRCFLHFKTRILIIDNFIIQ